MPWENFFGTLAPGQWSRWWWGWGNDRGAQFAMGNPLNPGGSLKSYDYTKTKENDGSIRYWVSIANTGSVTTNFTLQGGGLT